MSYTYNFIAYDSQGNLLPSAVGSFYADTDSALVNPMTVTTQDGVTTSSPTSNRSGLVYFTHDTEVRGYWKSGANTLRVSAWEAADAAAADAAAARVAAEAAAAITTAPTEATVRTVMEEDLADPASPVAVAVSGVAQSVVAPIAPDNSARAVGKGELTVNAKDYGLTGSNPAADTTAIQNAVNAAATFGLDVLIPAGTYTPTTTIALPNGSKVRGAPGTMINLTTVAGTPAFQGLGSAAAGVSITADVSEGATDVAVASASTFAPGDFVKISATTVASTVTSQPIGEIQRVRSISGNVLTFADPISRTYAASASAMVQKLTQATDISVRDIRFIGDANQITIKYQAIALDTCRNVSVSGCTFKYVHYVAVPLSDTIEARISNCHFEDALSTGQAYGVACWWATQDVSVVNCTSLRVRHQVTCGGGTSRPGTPRRITVVGCIATESIDAGFDAHSGCDNVSVIGCHVIGGGQDGIILQGRNALVSGCEITGVARYGIFIQGTSIGGVECVVTGNTVSRTGNRGIIVQVDGAVTQHQVWNGCVVSNNKVKITGNTGIEIQQLNTSIYAEQLAVTGNTVKGSAVYAILIRGWRDATISNNAVAITVANYGIYLLNSQDCIVTGNPINGFVGGVVTGQRGVYMSGGSVNNIVTANRIRGCVAGVGQDATSGTTIVKNNNMTGCTTSTNLAGTGNLVADNLP